MAKRLVCIGPWMIGTCMTASARGRLAVYVSPPDSGLLESGYPSVRPTVMSHPAVRAGECGGLGVNETSRWWWC
ncbi:hypothetical protein DFH27DRAFT_570473 [Peziza echinospora]|nr:hypothetical protein DFH27DRAFT_570473 [Peziza echinospora]